MNLKVLVFALLTIPAFGYSQDYMDDIVEKTCECLNTIPDSLGPDRFNMELGLCMINAAMPYKKQIKKEYNIDLNKIDQQGPELGRIIGLKMASVCPDGLVQIVKRVKGEESTVEELIFEGKIVSFEDSKFVEFSVKDELGKVTKFYWLGFVESNIDLLNNYKSLIDKSVLITFTTQEFFDARIAEYRTFNIIQKLVAIE